MNAPSTSTTSTTRPIKPIRPRPFGRPSRPVSVCQATICQRQRKPVIDAKKPTLSF